MDLNQQISELRRDATAAAKLPPRMRVLFITSYQRTGGWLTESLVTGRSTDTVLEEAVGAAAGVARLRDEVFDAVLVSHEPGDFDALPVVEAIRAGGTEDPVIVLGRMDAAETSVSFYDAGADAYLCVSTATARTLAFHVSRAIERVRLLRENRRFVESDRQRLEQEHNEASRLLDQQRTLIGDLERTLDESTSLMSDEMGLSQNAGGIDFSQSMETSPVAQPFDSQSASEVLPPQLIKHYGELVRAYVVMGSGNLAEEMRALAELLVVAGVTAHEAMLMHLDVVQELVRGRGTRSAKHLVSRAQLLILEIVVHLAEGYRGRWLEKEQPVQQQLLPGFDEAPAMTLGDDWRRESRFEEQSNNSVYGDSAYGTAKGRVA